MATIERCSQLRVHHYFGKEIAEPGTGVVLSEGVDFFDFRLRPGNAMAERFLDHDLSGLWLVFILHSLSGGGCGTLFPFCDLQFARFFLCSFHCAALFLDSRFVAYSRGSAYFCWLLLFSQFRQTFVTNSDINFFWYTQGNRVVMIAPVAFGALNIGCSIYFVGLLRTRTALVAGVVFHRRSRQIFLALAAISAFLARANRT